MSFAHVHDQSLPFGGSKIPRWVGHPKTSTPKVVKRWNSSWRCPNKDIVLTGNSKLWWPNDYCKHMWERKMEASMPCPVQRSSPRSSQLSRSCAPSARSPCSIQDSIPEHTSGSVTPCSSQEYRQCTPSARSPCSVQERASGAVTPCSSQEYTQCIAPPCSRQEYKLCTTATPCSRQEYKICTTATSCSLNTPTPRSVYSNTPTEEKLSRRVRDKSFNSPVRPRPSKSPTGKQSSRHHSPDNKIKLSRSTPLSTTPTETTETLTTRRSLRKRKKITQQSPPADSPSLPAFSRSTAAKDRILRDTYKIQKSRERTMPTRLCQMKTDVDSIIMKNIISSELLQDCVVPEASTPSKPTLTTSSCFAPVPNLPPPFSGSRIPRWIGHPKTSTPKVVKRWDSSWRAFEKDIILTGNSRLWWPNGYCKSMWAKNLQAPTPNSIRIPLDRADSWDFPADTFRTNYCDAPDGYYRDERDDEEGDSRCSTALHCPGSPSDVPVPLTPLPTTVDDYQTAVHDETFEGRVSRFVAVRRPKNKINYLQIL